jgi:DNA-binding CsgD family transcriptional regulator
LERSAALTLERQRRDQRLIAAATAHLEAGAIEAASALLETSAAGPLDELHRAHVETLRANAAAGWGHMGDATSLFLSAARRFEPIDVRFARDTYLRALVAADVADDLAREATIVEVAHAARAAPAPPGPGRPQDLLLDGLAIAATDGPAAAAPKLRRALGAFATVQLSPEEAWWLGDAQLAAVLLWDFDDFYSLATRFLRGTRDLGALRMLPWALDAFARVHVWGGDLATAASLVAEEQSVIEATGSSTTPWVVADLVAWRGHEAEARSTIAAGIEQARTRGQGAIIKALYCATATLCNSLGHYDEALIAAEKSTSPPAFDTKYFGLPELVEAAVRSGRPAVAAEAVEELAESTQASGTDWAVGVEARTRALLDTGGAAEGLYLDAIKCLDPSPLRPEAARAHLLYGEWLRRENRRVDARHQLRTAHDMFDDMGATSFGARARHELTATGVTVHSRRDATLDQLTPQEERIARMAGQGLSDAEIAGQLYISRATVDYHLRKVFRKLGVHSRTQLAHRTTPAVAQN